MEEIFSKDNFFSDQDIDFLIDRISSMDDVVDFVNHEGVFSNQLIANLVRIRDKEVLDWLHDKIKPTLDRPFNVVAANRLNLYLPWDVHTDHHTKECSPGHVPYYTFVIPLGDFDSRTIIFDQHSTESVNFSDYKLTHKPIRNSVSKDIWDEHLSMCWPKDRMYLSIKEMLPYQRRRQLVGFPSMYFHSSDNFHTRITPPKVFIQVRTETLA